jgi:hypothetical protein
MQIQSLGGSFFFFLLSLMITLDSQYYIYIFYKLKVLKKFQTYKYLVENHIGQKIKTFKFDDGGEYTSNDFNRF